ncbi:hypothetical protein DPMN_015234 [Dreissena polymorpha]|uniref:Uncharacterized protein n=1 Tax=Dreissena polymorpha TaxID=45954 RepID=A0A9D4NB46_DREPO|nr:hypothetical protein DPMN_015234 [Dreissena polymorpha]
MLCKLEPTFEFCKLELTSNLKITKLPDEEEILSSPEHAELGLPQSLAAKPALGPALNQIDLSGCGHRRI